MRVMLLIGIGALCAACTSHNVRLYEGDKKPRNEIAVLVVDGKGSEDDGPDDIVSEAYVISADGKPLNRANIVEMLPGSHEVEIEWAWFDVASRASGVRKQPASKGKNKYTFTAVAGGSYELDWDFWKQGPPKGIRSRK